MDIVTPQFLTVGILGMLLDGNLKWLMTYGGIILCLLNKCSVPKVSHTRSGSSWGGGGVNTCVNECLTNFSYVILV